MKTRLARLKLIQRQVRDLSPEWELHLEVLVDRLIHEFNIGVNVGNPQASYKGLCFQGK